MNNFNKKLTDDYQWDTYTQIYAQQAQDMVDQDNHNFDMLLNEIEILNFYKKKIIYQDDVQHRVGILLEK